MSSTKNPITANAAEDNHETTIAAANTGPPVFTTWTNIIVITWASLSLAVFGGLASVPAFVYVPQGMSLIWVTQVGIITSCLFIPLTLLVASLSDSLSGKWARWGRRKPFIFLSIPVIVISAFMLAWPAQNKSNPKVFDYFYLATMIIFAFPAALFSIPFSSWMIESCGSPAEYTTINGVLMLSSLFGGLLSQLILSSKYEGDPFRGAKLCAMFVLFSVPLSFLTLLWVVPGKELRQAPVQPPIVSSFRQCIRTKEFQTIFWNETLTQMASNGAGAFTFPILYLFFGLVHTDSVQKYFAPTIVAILIGSVVCILTLMWALKRFEKIVVYKTIMLLLVFLGLCSVATMVPAIISYGKPGFYTPEQLGTQIVAFLGIFALATMLGVCMNFCQGLLVRDLIIFDTFTNGLNREGMYQTAIRIPAGLFATIPSNLSLGILYSTGFLNKTGPVSADPYIDEVYGWNQGTLVQITQFSVIFSCVVGLGAYVLMTNYGLTTAVATKMEEANVKKEDKKKLVEAQKNERDAAHAADAGHADKAEVGRAKSASTGSTSTLESMDIINAPDAEAESHLMNHLSQLENKAITESSDVNGKNEALTRIRSSIILGGGLLAPAAMISLLVGVILQIKNNLPFVTLLLTMFQILAGYVGYEIFRYLAVRKLYALPSDDAKACSIRQVTRNEKYTLNLQEALEKAEIDENADDDTIPGDDHPIARLTMTKKSTMKSILVTAELEDEKHPLSGYKRIFAACAAVFVLGILGAIQK